MSLWAKRANIEAEHSRPDTTPDVDTVFEELGTIQIALPNELFVAQSEEGITAPTAEFEIHFDPKVDLRPGDVLVFFNGQRHEVRQVRTFVTGKRTDYSEADVERMELTT